MTATQSRPAAAVAPFGFTVLTGRDAPHAARLAADGRTEGWLDDDARFHMQLLLSEVVTNAVTHGASSATAPIVVKGAPTNAGLQIAVSSFGPPFAHAGDLPPDTQPGGRGLALVDALAARWGARHDSGWTTVWFEVGAGRR